MSLADFQKQVDETFRGRQKPYWDPLSQLAHLVEEVGELGRLLNHLYGDKPKKLTEAHQELPGELADVLFAVVCIANREKIDLDKAFAQAIIKTKTRDKDRFK